MKSICDRSQSSMLDQVRAEKRKLDEMKSTVGERLGAHPRSSDTNAALS